MDVLEHPSEEAQAGITVEWLALFLQVSENPLPACGKVRLARSFPDPWLRELWKHFAIDRNDFLVRTGRKRFAADNRYVSICS